MKNVKRDQNRITFSLKFGSEVPRLKVPGRLWWRYFSQEQIFLFPAFQLVRYLSYVYTSPNSACASAQTILDKVFIAQENGDFGQVSVRERLEGSLLDRHISDRFLCSLALFKQVLIPDCFLCGHEKEKLACTQNVDSLELKNVVDVITSKSDPTIFPCVH